MDLQFLFENFMACNIDLAKRQLFEVEKQSGEMKCLRNLS